MTRKVDHLATSDESNTFLFDRVTTLEELAFPEVGRDALDFLLRERQPWVVALTVSIIVGVGVYKGHQTERTCSPVRGLWEILEHGGARQVAHVPDLDEIAVSVQERLEREAMERAPGYDQDTGRLSVSRHGPDSICNRLDQRPVKRTSDVLVFGSLSEERADVTRQ